jgi:hypothetical protein
VDHGSGQRQDASSPRLSLHRNRSYQKRQPCYLTETRSVLGRWIIRRLFPRSTQPCVRKCSGIRRSSGD